MFQTFKMSLLFMFLFQGITYEPLDVGFEPQPFYSERCWIPIPSGTSYPLFT